MCNVMSHWFFHSSLFIMVFSLTSVRGLARLTLSASCKSLEPGKMSVIPQPRSSFVDEYYAGGPKQAYFSPYADNGG